MRINNQLVANNVLSSGTSFSNVMLSEDWIRASFQVVCGSGSLTGTFVVQVSNDLPVGLPPNQFAPTNWFTLGTQSAVCSLTSVANTMIPYFETSYHYHRVRFTPASDAQGWYSIRVESKNL